MNSRVIRAFERRRYGCFSGTRKTGRVRAKMLLFIGLLCLAAFLIVANATPVFDFGVDAKDGINDDWEPIGHPD